MPDDVMRCLADVPFLSKSIDGIEEQILTFNKHFLKPSMWWMMAVGVHVGSMWIMSYVGGVCRVQMALLHHWNVADTRKDQSMPLHACSNYYSPQLGKHAMARSKSGYQLPLLRWWLCTKSSSWVVLVMKHC